MRFTITEQVRKGGLPPLMRECGGKPLFLTCSILVTLLVIGVSYSVPVAQTRKPATAKPAGRYTCPMHPDIGSAKPGRCPKCQMALKFTRQKATTTPPETETASTDPGSTSSLRIPDVAVVDQNGKSLHFYSDLVKGKVIAVNFIFTTCTAICPSLTATFRRVQQELESRKLEAQLISISVDPTTDTPERLHAFAAKFKAEPGWTFITGDSAQIDSLLKELGVAVANKNDHTPMILIGNDAAGYWTRAYGLSSPVSIVKMLAAAAERK